MVQLRLSDGDSTQTLTLVFENKDCTTAKERLKGFIDHLLVVYNHSTSLNREKSLIPPAPVHSIDERTQRSTHEADETTEQQSKPASKSGNEAEIAKERQRILEDSPRLKKSFDHLVRNGYITSEQFWVTNGSYFAAKCKQALLPEEAFLTAPIRISKRPGATEEEFVLVSDQQRKQILAENDQVRECFTRLVPQKMMCEEFWTRFFQSKFYANMIGDPINYSSDTTFPEFDSEQRSHPTEAGALASVPGFLNLATEEGFKKPGYGSFLSDDSLFELQQLPTKISTKKNILKRFNRYGISTLKSMSTANLKYESPSNSICPTFPSASEVGIFDDEFKIEDLEAEVSSLKQRIVGKSQERGSQEAPDFNEKHSMKIQEERLHAAKGFIQRLTSHQWEAKPVAIPKKDYRFFFLLSTSLIQQRLQGDSQKELEEIAERPELKPIITMMRGLQTECKELLRHYWRLVDNGNPVQDSIIHGLKKYYQDIKRYVDNTFILSHSKLINPRALCNPLLEAVKHALEMYEQRAQVNCSPNKLHRLY